MIALLPPICAVVIIKKVSSELQSTLSKMTHREIMDHVGQFVVLHFSSDCVEQLKSYLYAFLDGDRKASLSEILDNRLTRAESVLLEGKEIQDAQQVGRELKVVGTFMGWLSSSRPRADGDK